MFNNYTARRDWIVNTGRLSPGAPIQYKDDTSPVQEIHCGDKTILRPSYLHNEISYTGKRTSLYWIRAQNPDKIDRKRLRLESPPPIVGDQKPYSTLIQKKLRARKAPRYTFPRVVMYVCSNISPHLNRALRNQLNPITKVMDIFVRCLHPVRR